MAVAVARPPQSLYLAEDRRWGAGRSSHFLDVSSLAHCECSLVLGRLRNVIGPRRASVIRLFFLLRRRWIAPLCQELLRRVRLFCSHDEACPREFSVVVVQRHVKLLHLVQLKATRRFKCLPLRNKGGTESPQDALSLRRRH